MPRRRVFRTLNYRGYRFKNKDLLCDALRTVIRDEEGLNDNQAAAISGVAAGTVHNWLDGPTMRPQNACVMALTNILGYARTDAVDPKTGEIVPAFRKVKKGQLDIQKERELTADFLLKEGRRKKKPSRRKRNGHAVA